MFADYRDESANCSGHYRDARRRRIAVLATTLSERVGVSPTRLLAMVNAAGPVPFEKSHSVAPRRYRWGEVERRFGWTESVVAVYRAAPTPRECADRGRHAALLGPVST